MPRCVHVCACPPPVDFRFFEDFAELDYARAGNRATATVVVTPEEFATEYGFPFSMLEPLRKLAVPVVLDKGVLRLEREVVVCHEGDVLTPEQGRLLVRVFPPFVSCGAPQGVGARCRACCGVPSWGVVCGRLGGERVVFSCEYCVRLIPMCVLCPISPPLPRLTAPCRSCFGSR